MVQTCGTCFLGDLPYLRELAVTVHFRVQKSQTLERPVEFWEAMQGTPVGLKVDLSASFTLCVYVHVCNGGERSDECRVRVSPK